MGFFSKKTIICERCGKEYQARITLGCHICNECLDREMEKEENVRGYVDYASRMAWDSYTEEQLDQIAKHRDDILEKYSNIQGISKDDLISVSMNYKELTDEEAENVLIRAANSTISKTMGSAYTDYFFAPTSFEKTVVDVEDVFAVGYTSDYRLKSENEEIILCAVFTNDPYIPVFPIVYVGKRGFFEFGKSKKGRQGVNGLFESMCPNLTYPVQDIKKLKKQIKADGLVKGNIDMKFMLREISEVLVGSGIFNTEQLDVELPSSTAEMLEKCGYIQEDEINIILGLDKMFSGRFWRKHLDRLTKNY